MPNETHELDATGEMQADRMIARIKRMYSLGQRANESHLSTRDFAEASCERPREIRQAIGRSSAKTLC